MEKETKSKEELLEEKKATLETFSRVKADDPEVIEKGKQVLKADEIAHLEQVILDDQAEIDRRTAHKAEAEAELAKYKK